MTTAAAAMVATMTTTGVVGRELWIKTTKVGLVIGRGGLTLKRIREETGARVEVMLQPSVRPDCSFFLMMVVVATGSAVRVETTHAIVTCHRMLHMVPVFAFVALVLCCPTRYRLLLSKGKRRC